jgi:hypothetical protein
MLIKNLIIIVINLAIATSIFSQNQGITVPCEYEADTFYINPRTDNTILELNGKKGLFSNITNDTVYWINQIGGDTLKSEHDALYVTTNGGLEMLNYNDTFYLKLNNPITYDGNFAVSVGYFNLTPNTNRHNFFGYDNTIDKFLFYRGRNDTQNVRFFDKIIDVGITATESYEIIQISCNQNNCSIWVNDNYIADFTTTYSDDIEILFSHNKAYRPPIFQE